MYKKAIFSFFVLGFLASSCNKHEVIPAPEPKVDLFSSFEGKIGGNFLQYTENVDGYYGVSQLVAQATGGNVDAQYYFSMISPSYSQSIKIGMGSLSWTTATGTTTPALSIFNPFFTANDLPPYKNSALGGFEVQYKDVYNDLWVSKDTSTFVKNVIFEPTSIIQESDKTGDYSKFKCDFNCTIYHTYSVIDIAVIPQTSPPTMRDSLARIKVEDAIYRGWFKR